MSESIQVCGRNSSSLESLKELVLSRNFFSFVFVFVDFHKQKTSQVLCKSILTMKLI